MKTKPELNDEIVRLNKLLNEAIAREQKTNQLNSDLIHKINQKDEIIRVLISQCSQSLVMWQTERGDA